MTWVVPHKWPKINGFAWGDKPTDYCVISPLYITSRGLPCCGCEHYGIGVKTTKRKQVIPVMSCQFFLWGEGVPESGMIRWVKYEKLKQVNMGLSKNRGTPKWMVSNGKPY